jgi:hypothetical protein
MPGTVPADAALCHGTIFCGVCFARNRRAQTRKRMTSWLRRSAALGTLDVDEMMAHNHRLEAVRAPARTVQQPARRRESYLRTARMTASLPEQRCLTRRAVQLREPPDLGHCGRSAPPWAARRGRRRLCMVSGPGLPSRRHRRSRCWSAQRLEGGPAAALRPTVRRWSTAWR